MKRVDLLAPRGKGEGAELRPFGTYDSHALSASFVWQPRCDHFIPCPSIPSAFPPRWRRCTPLDRVVGSKLEFSPRGDAGGAGGGAADEVFERRTRLLNGPLHAAGCDDRRLRAVARSVAIGTARTAEGRQVEADGGLKRRAARGVLPRSIAAPRGTRRAPRSPPIRRTAGVRAAARVVTGGWCSVRGRR